MYSPNLTVTDSSVGAGGKIRTVALAGGGSKLTVEAGTIGYINWSGPITVTGGTVEKIDATGAPISVSGGKVTSVEMHSYGGTLEVTGGTVENVLMRANPTTLTNNGGKVENVTIADPGAKLVGGPFPKVSIQSSTDLTLENIRGGYVAEGHYLFNSNTGKIITAADIKREGGKYTISVPVTVTEHTHNYNQDTRECSCGDADKAAKVVTDDGTTFYDTLQDAFDAVKDAQNYPTIVVLKDDTENTIINSGELLLDLNGHTLGTLESSRFIDVTKSDASGTIRSIRVKSGTLFIDRDSNDTIEHAILEGGALEKYGGTVQKVTIVKSESTPQLRGGPFDQVYIESAEQLENDLDLSVFTRSSECLTTEGGSVSAENVLLSKETKTDGGYVYTLGGPISISESHTFDQTTGLCSCGHQAEAMVNGIPENFFSKAFDTLLEDAVVKLLKDIQRENPLYVGRSMTIDWNGHTFQGRLYVSEGNLHLKDSEGGGGIKNLEGSCISLQWSGTLTIEGGTYQGNGNSKPFSGYDATNLILPIGYAFYDEDNKVVDWKNNGFPSGDAVTVKKHESHSYNKQNGICTVCGESAGAKVVAGNSTYFYATLQRALTYANSQGWTTSIYLLQDAGEGTYELKGKRNLYLNGHNILGELTASGATDLNVYNGSDAPATVSALRLKLEEYTDVDEGIYITGRAYIEPGVTVKTVVQESGYLTNNGTIGSVTLEGGTLDNVEGTISSVTIVKSEKAIRLCMSNCSYGNVSIRSNTQLTTLDLSVFAGGNCLQVGGKPVSAEAVLKTGQSTEDGYVYTVGDEVYISGNHAFDLDTGLCPCGRQAAYKVGDQVFTDFGSAIAGASNVTVQLLANAEGQDTAYGIPNGTDITIDWNGHITQLNLEIYNGGSVTFQDSKGGGKLQSSKIMLRGGQLKIQSGTYEASSFSGKFGDLHVAEGYASTTRPARSWRAGQMASPKTPPP